MVSLPVTPHDIVAADARITPYVRRTPVMDVAPSVWSTGRSVSLKLELLQVTGSFKARGAFNTLISEPPPAAGVTAASGGNHGAAVAHAATLLGVPSRIFVPSVSPPVKQDRIRRAGGEVVVSGARYDEALAACLAYAAETGARPVHAFDAAATIAGQGTLAREWEQQVGAAALDTVLVAVGGGGLIGGIAAWFGDRVRVVGVEPEGACCLARALAAGDPVDGPVASVAADSLGAPRVGRLAFDLARARVERVVLVSDAAISEAQAHLWNSWRLAAEPGGAAALAALIAGAYRPAPDERLGVLLCGGNVDLAGLADLAAAGGSASA